MILGLNGDCRDVDEARQMSETFVAAVYADDRYLKPGAPTDDDRSNMKR